jgi:2-dehydro-3-deoxygalactonokinase
MIISIDGGTTNTRFTLIDNGNVFDRVKRQIGLRNAIKNGIHVLSEAVKSGISELFERNPELCRNVKLIALSGMIGSEAGLCRVDHIPVPAGAYELKQSAKRVFISEISDLPLLFIPGVKTFTDPKKSDLDELDIMRGEETEIVGIHALLNNSMPFTAILPGSHMKIADIDSNGRILMFRTSLSGELMRAAAENTILYQSLGDVYPKKADDEFLHLGYDYAEKHGVNEALFKIRLMAGFVDGTKPEQLYSFLMGAILRDDINSIISSEKNIVVGGSDPLRSAIVSLLNKKTDNITVLPDKLAEECSAIGAEIICRDLI